MAGLRGGRVPIDDLQPVRDQWFTIFSLPGDPTQPCPPVSSPPLCALGVLLWLRPRVVHSVLSVLCFTTPNARGRAPACLERGGLPKGRRCFFQHPGGAA